MIKKRILDKMKRQVGNNEKHKDKQYLLYTSEINHDLDLQAKLVFTSKQVKGT